MNENPDPDTDQHSLKSATVCPTPDSDTSENLPRIAVGLPGSFCAYLGFMFGIHFESHQNVTYGNILMTLVLCIGLSALTGGFRASRPLFKLVLWLTAPFGGVRNPAALILSVIVVACGASAFGFGLGWIIGCISDWMGLSNDIVVPAISLKD